LSPQDRIEEKQPTGTTMSTEVFILIVSTIILVFWLISLRNKSAAMRQPHPVTETAFRADSSPNRHD